MLNFSRLMFIWDKRLTIEQLLIRLSLGLALTAIVLWLFLNSFGPMLIEQVYQGRSISILNTLITGQREHPVSEYISAFEDHMRIGFLLMLVLSGTLYLIQNAIRHQAHIRSVTHQNTIFFALLFVLIVLRDPTLFTEPRFWAEEATVYFWTAYLMPAWGALISPHQGYLSLWANLAGLLATIPPLEYAPAVTTGMSLFVLLVILAAVLVNESDTLCTSLNKAIAGVAALVVGATGEIWLTSINSQHYMPLLVFLILIDSKCSPLKRRVWFGVAAIAGLSSVAVNFLAPLFLLRYRQRRERADLVLFFILASTTAIELAAIAYSSFILGDAAYYHASQRRVISDFNAISVMNNIFYYAFAYPLFGHSKLLAYVGAAALLGTGYLARASMRDHWVFLGAVLLLSSLSVVSSMGMHGGPRYAYSASVIISLLMLAYSFNSRIPRAARITASILLIASITYWSLHYMDGLRDFRDPRWPTWSEEVRTWRTDPSIKLQAHPIWQDQTDEGLVWSVKLPPEQN